MQLLAASDRRAFAHWLRTGRLPDGGTAQVIELKFNPYHDPRNGRFTFAPGGLTSSSAALSLFGPASSERFTPTPSRRRQSDERTTYSTIWKNKSLHPRDIQRNLRPVGFHDT
ncbi:MAG: hypothetical protein C0500_13130 [Sphingobium sp.]|nr:hypothetical protein [Sphingobium sp.]